MENKREWIAPERENGRYRGGDVIPTPEMLELAQQAEQDMNLAVQAGRLKFQGWSGSAWILENQQAAVIGPKTGFRLIPSASEEGPRLVSSIDSWVDHPGVDRDFIFTQEQTKDVEETLLAFMESAGSNLEGKEGLTEFDRRLWAEVCKQPVATYFEQLLYIAFRNVAPERQENLVRMLTQKALESLKVRYRPGESDRIIDSFLGGYLSSSIPFRDGEIQWGDDHFGVYGDPVKQVQSQHQQAQLRNYWAARVLERVRMGMVKHCSDHASLKNRETGRTIPGENFYWTVRAYYEPSYVNLDLHPLPRTPEIKNELKQWQGQHQKADLVFEI